MMKKRIAIIDYGLGNLFSVKQACKTVGLEAIITSDQKTISSSDMVILPGVGAYGVAMNNLNKKNLIPVLNRVVLEGKPFIGICLGMQLMFSESEEFGIHKGLDFFKGKIKKFASNKNNFNFRVPQIQWNTISKTNGVKANSFFNFLENKSYMYFVHSYYCVPKNKSHIVANTNYAGIKYPSIVKNKNIIGIQFHPEKSGKQGIEIYKKLTELI